jgi:hypothetical protein
MVSEWVIFGNYGNALSLWGGEDGGRDVFYPHMGKFEVKPLMLNGLIWGFSWGCWGFNPHGGMDGEVRFSGAGGEDLAESVRYHMVM